MSLVGMELGCYRLLRLIGSGNRGEVYLADDLNNNRQVAVKIVQTRKRTGSDPTHVDDASTSFLGKCRAIAKLDHPNILPLYEFGKQTTEETMMMYIVMPFCHGGSLARWISGRGDSGLLPIHTIIHLVRQAASALQYAHYHGIIHQDVQPNNFLLRQESGSSNDPDLLLTDFNVSGGIDTASEIDTVTITGNPTCLAPEMCEGKPVFATDQYALAIMAYEMLTGRPPFTGDSAITIIVKQLNEQPLPPSKLNPRLSADIDWVLLHALAKRPEDRFASISAFAKAFEQAAESLPEQNIDGKALLFFSYATQDRALRDKLEEHLSNLKYRGLITTWHEREITAGKEVKQQIDIHFDKAQIILLLISASFMASDYCYGVEMERALTRQKQGEARVIPILLRPVLFTGAPFAMFKMLPTNGKPVVNWRNRDSAFVDIALGIERVIEESKLVRRVGAAPSQVVQPAPSILPSFQPAYQVPFAASGSAYGAPQSQYNAFAPPPPAAGQRLLRLSYRFVFVGLAILIVLLTMSVLLALHPNVLPPVLLGLLVLAGILAAIRITVIAARNKREKAELRQRQETLAHEREEAQRRAQEQEEARGRAEAYKQQEQEREYYNKALTAYEQALRLNSRDVTALKGKANALEGLGRYSEALEALSAALALDANAVIYSRIGDVLAKLRRYDDALAAYKQAVMLDATFADAYYHMGEVLYHLGRGQEAEQAREKAKELGYEA